MNSFVNIQVTLAWKSLWLGNLFLHVSHLCFLLEEFILNRFDFGINSGLTLIVDEHESLSLVSFIPFSRSIEISFRFDTFNRVSAASSVIVNFSIR
jgi:hypothetical protein